ncbi:methionine ABC transporter permease [Orbus sturtevantii]|uniref:methionine ABC transporter permease n=1 Tax=Orbus sturtevantii TaxID=3074109 RepID=UPI00370DA577
MFGFSTTITLDLFLVSLYQTFYMVVVSLFFGMIIGTVIAISLVVYRPSGIKPNAIIYNILNTLINILRSIPSLILLVTVLPLSKFIVGTSFGTTAAIVPLIFFVCPYIARLVENSLLEVSDGIIEAADAMGATTWQVIWHFLLPEAKSSLVLSYTTATIGLIGATTIAGAIGAGGIGDLALNYGYQRFDNVAMISTVVTLIIIVQVIQSAGNQISKSMRHRYRRN